MCIHHTFIYSWRTWILHSQLHTNKNTDTQQYSMQMWSVISESTLPPATEVALYPKNSRMTRGEFQIQKYILPPNCKGKVGFLWSWGSYAAIYRNCRYTYSYSVRSWKDGGHVFRLGVSETWTKPLRTLCPFAANTTALVAECKKCPWSN